MTDTHKNTQKYPQMNAYELADWIEEWAGNYEIWANKKSSLRQVMDMLRQQADRIKVLEASYKAQLNNSKKSLQYIVKLEKKIINLSFDKGTTMKTDILGLANEIDAGTFNTTNFDVHKTANFLRKVSDRIAELEHQIEKVSHYEAMTEQSYKERIAELEKEIQNLHMDEMVRIGQEIDNEPVAMRYDFDGYGWMYIDSGSGSDWKTRKKGEFLYTKPSLKSDTKVNQEFSSTQENEPNDTSQERVYKTENQRHITVQEKNNKNV